MSDRSKRKPVARKSPARRFFTRPFEDVIACLEPIVTVGNPIKALAPLIIALILGWFVYVPIHELLHAFGCWVTGGEVTRLEISPTYGAALIAKVFPFVVPGGEYAGRLSGFETHGNDWIYLATDFGPFLLTVLLGVPLVKLAARRRRPVVFGLGIVVGLAPFYNLPGDYLEMGSIVTTRMVTVLRGWSGPPAYEKLRSDNVFKLLGTYVMHPAELGLVGPWPIAGAAAVIFLSLVIGLLLAFLTYALGSVFAGWILPTSPPRPT